MSGAPPSFSASERARRLLSPVRSERRLARSDDTLEYERGAFEPAQMGAVARRRGPLLLLVLVSVVGTVGVASHYLPRSYESFTTVLLERERARDDSRALDVLDRIGRVSEMETEIGLISSRRVIEPVVDALALHVTGDVGVSGSSAEASGAWRRSGPAPRPQALLPGFRAERDAEPADVRIRRTATGGSYLIGDAGSDEIWARLPAGARFEERGLAFDLPTEDPGWNEITLSVTPFGEAVEAARERIGVYALQRDAQLIEIACEADAPERAQELCSRVSDSYMSLRTELQKAEAAAAGAFLGEQVDLVKDRLRIAEDSLEAYGRVNHIAALDERAVNEVRLFSERTARVEQLRAERTALARLIEEIEGDHAVGWRSRDVASFPTFLLNETVTALLTTLVDLENQRAELAVRRSDVNPDVVALDQRVTAIEGQLRSFARSYESSLADEIEGIEGSLLDAGARLAAIPTFQVQYARLERQSGLLSDLYQYLETRRREAEVAEAVNLPSVRILDVADLPAEPSSPNLPRNLALGVLLGLAAGLTLVLFQEVTDTRIHGRRDLERDIPLPILSVVPSVRRPGPVVPIDVDRGVAALDASAKLALGKRRDPRGYHPGWRTEVTKESFRSLIADLGFVGHQGGREPRVIAVTSAGPGEGKTFVASNMALVRASQGARTLLVDADMRASGVSHFFGLTHGAGMAEVLAGATDAHEVTQRIRIERSGPLSSGTLSVVPSGRPTSHSAALLQGGALGTFLRDARESHDFVVVDTPPLNVLSDAVTIAHQVDGVLVVVRGGVTDRRALHLTLERLERAGARVIGVVLNDVTLPRGYAEYTYAYTQASDPSPVETDAHRFDHASV